MQKLIIHTDTGVIRRITTDEIPSIEKDESVVETDKIIDLAGEGDTKYWKFDKGEKIPASQVEVELAKVDLKLESEKRLLLKTNLKRVISELAELDLTTQMQLPAKLKEYFIILRDLDV